MTKPAVTLVLGTVLLAARVQDTFGGGRPESSLYYAPGFTFNESIDLLTRYTPMLADKIKLEFYAPSFLKPRVKDRVTVPVADLTPVTNLPKMSPAVLRYAMIPGTGNTNIFTAQKLNHTYAPSTNSVKYEQACRTYKTASPQYFHPRDTQIMEAAKNKLKRKIATAPSPTPAAGQEKVEVVISLASRAASTPVVVSVLEPGQGWAERAPESETANTGCRAGTSTSVSAPVQRPNELAALGPEGQLGV